MKLSLVTALLFTSFLNASEIEKSLLNGKEKSKKENKEIKEEGRVVSRNFHSVKKWKVTIEYDSGDRISKIIVVDENSKLSAMTAAFEEAEKYLHILKSVKHYSVSPVSEDSFVLLAGG